MLYRHPFPGPGLGVRVLGEVRKSIVTCCAVLTPSSLKNCESGPVRQSQPGVHRLPASTFVGVMGDGRKYDWVVSLRAVEPSTL